MKRCFMWLGLAAIACGLGVLVYRGPGHAFARAHVGDVAAVMLVYAVLGLTWRARPAVRASLTLAIATAIELGQVVWHPHSTAATLVLGSTFDPWDLCAYVVGVALAVLWELHGPAGQRRRTPLQSLRGVDVS